MEREAQFHPQAKFEIQNEIRNSDSNTQQSFLIKERQKRMDSIKFLLLPQRQEKVAQTFEQKWPTRYDPQSDQLVRIPKIHPQPRFREVIQILRQRQELYTQAIIANGRKRMKGIDTIPIEDTPKTTNEIDTAFSFIRPFTTFQQYNFENLLSQKNQIPNTITEEVSPEINSLTASEPQTVTDIISTPPATSEFISLPVIQDESGETESQLHIFTVNEDEGEIIYNGQTIELTDDEYFVFLELSVRYGEPVSNLLLRDIIYENPAPNTSSQIRDAIKKLEEKIKILTGKDDIFTVEERPRSIIATLDNCEIEVDEEVEDKSPKEQPTVLLFTEKDDIPFVIIENKAMIFNSGERRLLQEVAGTSDFITRKLLSEKTGITTRELKSHLSTLAATLTRMIGKPISLEESPVGLRLIGATFEISQAATQPIETEVEEVEVEVEPESSLESSNEVNLEDSQYSTILGAMTYRLLNQNQQSLIQVIGQEEFDSLTESCRLLSLRIRATSPSSHEQSRQASMQNISLEVYKDLRQKLLERIKDLGESESQTTAEILALSEEHNRIINWFLRQDKEKLSEMLQSLTDLEDPELNIENDYYKNSWQKNPDSKVSFDQPITIYSSAKLKEMSSSISDAINIASTKRIPDTANVSIIERAFKEKGKKIVPINKSAVQFALRSGLIGSTGLITSEDIRILAFLYLTGPGKSLRKSYSGNTKYLKVACDQIRQEMTSIMESSNQPS